MTEFIITCNKFHNSQTIDLLLKGYYDSTETSMSDLELIDTDVC